ncbi:DOMON domain protein (macronuclear) [Tetrahymena thermophila SB210]|uniref:DOMON domain protein n=1 Tax=Tetrahymena thermophila (strain SB210) TaxID=312017 RepID=I7MAY9_TETTS|nr:DOMON domain protein [Tetrahymena thermophila SB210]EAS06749.3 DOMON domain protein [Tetrahymena thermophila SB210]|eukprot:XP_001026991.3 DOMON domain protein [Tetrahymena thermophila SB210]
MIKTTCVLFCLFLSFGLTISTQNNEQRILQANDLSPLSSSMMLTNGLTLDYQIQGTDLIMMIESTKQQGWIGVGFGATMSNTDMVIFFANQGGQPAVSDVYSSGEVTPSTDTQQDWTLLGSQITSSSFKMKAKRALSTGDSQDTVLVQGKSYSFCVAWSSSTSFVQHDDYYSFSGKLDNNLGTVQATAINIGVGEVALNVHKVWLFYGWGIGADIGIFVGRYLKAWKHHILVHAMIFFIINVSTIVLEAIVINGNDYKLGDVSNLDSNVKNHFIIGCVIMALIILQHLGGILLKIGIEGTNKHVNTIKKFHLVSGIIIYALAKANILIGTDLNSPTSITYNYNQGIIITVISIVFLFFCELFSRFYKYKTSNQIFDTNKSFDNTILNENPDHQELLRMLNVEKREISQIIAALPNLKWVIYNQGIYDISDLVHPGGQFIIKEVIGKEVGRYMLGALPLEGHNFQPYAHSSSAFNLLKKNKIGDLNYGESNILALANQKESNEAENNNNKLKLFNNYKLIKKTQISETTSQFEFQANDLVIKNVLQGVNWIGRHFLIKTQNSNKSRLYTQLNCMTDENVNLRQQLVNFAKNKLEMKNTDMIDVKTLSKYSQTLPFIIKKYNFSGALSKTIHEQNSQISYQIYGPLGNGLGFSELTQNKKFCIMTAGTGILPFLDLFDFLLKKQIQQSVPDHAKELDPFNVNYNKYFEGCQFTVYCAFLSLDDFVGKEWVLFLNQLSKQTQNNLFKLVLKVSKGQMPENVEKLKFRGFQDLITSEINNESFDKIYICGPPVMFNSTIEALQKKQVENTKIFIV